MTVTIHDLRPLDAHPAYSRPYRPGLLITGATKAALQNVQVFYELTAKDKRPGVQSANLAVVSDERGHWRVEVPGDFAPGTEIKAFARAALAPLAIKSITV